MPLKLNSSGGGSVTLQEPTTASNVTLNLPAVDGTMQIIRTETAKSATGTSVDFTGIPSWVKRITVMFNNVSTSGASLVQLQLGAGSVQTTGYNGNSGNFTSATPLVNTYSSGFVQSSGGSAGDFRNGAYTLVLVGSNIWICTSQFAVGAYFTFGTGQVALSGTLDRVRITTVNGTDTFDNGSINILMEG